MDKIAFFSMDIESLYDTFILKDKAKYNEAYSYEEKMIDYLNLLDKYNIKATLFVTITSLNKVKDILKEAIKRGHEVALHGLTHKSPMDMTEIEFINNLKEGKRILETELNTSVIGYRAPMFGIDDNKIELIKKEGFLYDSSDLSFRRAIKSGGIDLESYTKDYDFIHHKDNFYEFSMSKVSAYSSYMPVSGGGYLRLVPWFVYKYYINKFLRKYNSYMFYCHPFETSYSILPKFSGLNKRERMYLSVGRFNYLYKTKKVIKTLIRKKYKFYNLKEYIKMQGNH